MSEWINVEDEIPTNKDSMYWVYACGKVQMCRLNVYPRKTYWQCLGNTDFTMKGTKYIEVKKPKSPEEG